MATLEQISQFLATDFPQCGSVLEAVGEREATMRHHIGEDELRPGGTVSGPVMMALADVAIYAAILGTIGIVPLAVTTSLNINFLRKPSADKDLIGVCKLIKVGRILVVGDVYLYSDGDDQPVAHVVGTYSIPPARAEPQPASAL
jgi:uncharacterized protein (TIGR00369 family)